MNRAGASKSSINFCRDQENDPAAAALSSRVSKGARRGPVQAPANAVSRGGGTRLAAKTILGLWIGLTAVLAMGCAGYKLGPTNGVVAGDKSVQLRPFANQTLEPRLTDEVTAQLRKALQHDGTYRLATHDDGDIIVSGSILHYQRIELSFLPNNTLTVRDYRIKLTAQVTARERSSGKVIFDQPVTGTTMIRLGSDLTSTERQALPLLAADLAKNVTALLVDGTW
jgi:lipopolysaccharide assembly LptE-like protein